MIKKVSIFALSMLAFAACKNTGTGSAADNDASQDSPRVETVYDIAYIRMDSLVNGYNRYLDLSGEFEAKATKVQNDLEVRARRLQNEMIDFEEKMNKGLATRSQLADMQAQLQTKSQQFEADRQNRVAELAEEEQVMTNQIMYAIQQYVTKYNAGYRFKMILTSSGGNPILHADPALDITGDILKGLNEEYAAEQAAAKK